MQYREACGHCTKPVHMWKECYGRTYIRYFHKILFFTEFSQGVVGERVFRGVKNHIKKVLGSTYFKIKGNYSLEAQKSKCLKYTGENTVSNLGSGHCDHPWPLHTGFNEQTYIVHQYAREGLISKPIFWLQFLPPTGQNASTQQGPS